MALSSPTSFLSEYPSQHQHAHSSDTSTTPGWLADAPTTTTQPTTLQPLDMSFLNAMFEHTGASLYPWPFKSSAAYEPTPPSFDPTVEWMDVLPFIPAQQLYMDSTNVYADTLSGALSSVNPRVVSEPCLQSPCTTTANKVKRPRGRPRRSAIVRSEPYPATHHHHAPTPPHVHTTTFIHTFVASTAALPSKDSSAFLPPYSPESIYSFMELPLSSSYCDGQDTSIPSSSDGGFSSRSSISVSGDDTSSEQDLSLPCATFACHWDTCSITYSTLEQLVDHVVNVHVRSGRSFYVCDWRNCPRKGASFTKRHKMLTHVRTHTGEKPFICTFAGCNRAFTRADARVAHERIHQNVRPYSCTVPGCQRRYYHARSLRKHVKSHASKHSLHPSDEEEQDDEDEYATDHEAA